MISSPCFPFSLAMAPSLATTRQNRIVIDVPPPIWAALAGGMSPDVGLDRLQQTRRRRFRIDDLAAIKNLGPVWLAGRDDVNVRAAVPAGVSPLAPDHITPWRHAY